MPPRVRERPKELPNKLVQIRNHFGMSQTEMWKALGLENQFTYHVISHYETGLQEPSIIVLLKYARFAEVPMEVLADDKLSLPKKITKRTS